MQAVGIERSSIAVTLQTGGVPGTQEAARAAAATRAGDPSRAGKDLSPPAADSITISEAARNLSDARKKESDRPAEENGASPTDRQKREERNQPKPEKVSRLDVVKQFPPFLSPERLREILEKYPFFRRQIEAMMVPPPFLYSAELIRSVTEAARPDAEPYRPPTSVTEGRSDPWKSEK